MCGHIGMAGRLSSGEEQQMKPLLVLDSIRGLHSTGMAVIGRNSVEPKLAKVASHPYDLFDMPCYTKAFSGMNRVIIGHNRHATVGEVNKKNTHPFDLETVVGAHNGTLTSKYKLENASDFKTDSENIFHHIETKGLPDALSKMQGAWALVWWDKLEETINFLRNKERPLWFIQTADKSVLYWTSECWMVERILDRDNKKYEEPFLLKEDTHIAIPVDKEGTLGKWHIKEAKGAPPTVYQGHQGGNYPFVGGGTPNNQVTTSPATTPGPVTTSTSQASTKVVELKKGQVVPLTPSLPDRKVFRLRPGYENSKDVALKVDSFHTDKHGSCYYRCIDEANPSAQVRLYYHARTHDNRIRAGSEVLADIGKLCIDKHEGSYYKTKNDSVRYVLPVIEEEEKVEVVDLYKGSDGKMHTYDKWMKKYGVCRFCMTTVEPTDNYKLSNRGDSFCSDCAEDREVMPYVTFV